ncbi:MAG: ribosomal subunit interface protein [Crocinitomicaceae bacterium]|jgi:ribosomal subunit interface protein
MERSIEFVNFDRSLGLEKAIHESLDKIESKYNWIIRVQVYLKDQNESDGAGKLCEMKLSVPGPQLFASASESEFIPAIHETQRELERQLKKYKEMHFDNRRK